MSDSPRTESPRSGSSTPIIDVGHSGIAYKDDNADGFSMALERGYKVASLPFGMVRESESFYKISDPTDSVQTDVKQNDGKIVLTLSKRSIKGLGKSFTRLSLRNFVFPEGTETVSLDDYPVVTGLFPTVQVYLSIVRTLYLEVLLNGKGTVTVLEIDHSSWVCKIGSKPTYVSDVYKGLNVTHSLAFNAIIDLLLKKVTAQVSKLTDTSLDTVKTSVTNFVDELKTSASKRSGMLNYEPHLCATVGQILRALVNISNAICTIANESTSSVGTAAVAADEGAAVATTVDDGAAGAGAAMSRGVDGKKSGKTSQLKTLEQLHRLLGMIYCMQYLTMAAVDRSSGSTLGKLSIFAPVQVPSSASGSAEKKKYVQRLVIQSHHFVNNTNHVVVGRIREQDKATSSKLKDEVARREELDAKQKALHSAAGVLADGKSPE